MTTPTAGGTGARPPGGPIPATAHHPGGPGPRVRFSWLLPTGGDGGQMGAGRPDRSPSTRYLVRLAQAAELAGWDEVLVPCTFGGPGGAHLDAYTVGVACLTATTTLQVTITHRPGFIEPGVFARMCATATEMSDGRLAVMVVTAGADADSEQLGDTLSHDQRYRRAAEFVTILRALWGGQPVTFDGEYYSLAGTQLAPIGAPGARPPLYLTGGSPAAVDMAGRQADVYMLPAQPVGDVARVVEAMRQRAAPQRPPPRIYLAATVFSAGTQDEAVRLARAAAPDQPAAGGPRRSPAGFALRASLNAATPVTVTPWSGIAQPPRGAALVGSHEQLAALIGQYVEAGAEGFQLFGYPYFETALSVGAGLLPAIRAHVTGRGAATGPRGT